MNASDRMLDLSVVRQLLLQRLISGENRSLNRQLDSIAAEIEKQLKGKNFTEYQGRRLDRAISDLQSLVQITPPNAEDLAKAEADFAIAQLGSISITAALPSAATLSTIATSSLIEGATITQWFSKLNEQVQFDIQRAVKLGVSLGETNRQISDRILAKTDKGPAVFAKARRDAMALVRTSVQTIANEARLATYSENSDVIKAVQWVSTLDGRTTEICIARSGKTWSLPDFKPVGHSIPWNGGPPAHWSCRSTTIPITKTFEELGAAGQEIPKSTRASMDGQVAADLTFDQFLKGKPDTFADEMLGKGKAELWRSGKITLSQLLSANGTPLTLQELVRKYG